MITLKVFVLCNILCCFTAAQFWPSQNQQNGDYSVIPLNSPSAQRPTSQQSSQSAPLPVDESISLRFNYFDLKLLKVLHTKSQSQNVFVSPASIKATLGMIFEGAKGDSAAEIALALRITSQPQYVRDQLKDLLYDVSEQNRYTQLQSANAIFVSDKAKVNSQYERNIKDFYKGQIFKLNYNNVQQSVNSINNWISTLTKGLIPTIVGPENIKRDTAVLLANAMYFKSIWKYTFDPKLTTEKCFHLQNGQCQNVQMMQNNAEVPYKFVGAIDAHALEIPYNDDYAMLVLVPQVKNAIGTLLDDLQHVTFNTVVGQLQKTEVTYEIPKFDIEYDVPLRGVLQQMDINQVFSENADISGIVQNERVRVDNILHRAKIEVNEQGTVAAAATASVVIPLMGSSTPHVIANHPFVFFIYKKSNSNIIFQGIVNNPSVAQSSGTDTNSKPVVTSRANTADLYQTTPQYPQYQSTPQHQSNHPTGRVIYRIVTSGYQQQQVNNQQQQQIRF